MNRSVVNYYKTIHAMLVTVYSVAELSRLIIFHGFEYYPGVTPWLYCELAVMWVCWLSIPVVNHIFGPWLERGNKSILSKNK